ncbi:hypothetical protein EDB86DRAFT_2832929 [Lactarius hatsudake]|nr:hypothetical protein EDB86DRAFT_2832929 [Lactarius hatsudake]
MPPTSKDDFTSPSKNQCSQSKCKALLPVGCKYKTCDKCRNVSKLSMQKKRKRDKRDEDPHHRQAPAPGNSNTTEKGPVEYIYVGSEMESASDESKENTPVRFKDNHTIMTQLQKVFKTTERIFFCGSYDAPVDPLISYKDLVSTTAHDIWKVTGYRFRVKDNKPLQNGHKTRYWCCQDESRRQKSRPSQREGAKHWDTLGMCRYESSSESREKTYTITISLEHHKRHIPYYDVSLPPDAAALIRDSLEWRCPSEIAKMVQSTYPTISTKQVHKAWTTMSETLWKKNIEPLPSVRALLSDLKDDVDILNLPEIEGVEQVAWVMKKIISPLQGKIVEVGIDATYNTNSMHLELYAILGEHDKFPPVILSLNNGIIC